MRPTPRALAVLSGLSLLVVRPLVAAAHPGPPDRAAFRAYALGVNSGEPSIGYDPQADAAVYQSDTTTLRLTWGQDTQDAAAPMQASDVSAPTSVTSLDPIAFVDQRTHRTFVSQLAGACSLMSFSDDAGASWTPSEGCGPGALLDHQSVGGGPFHAPLTGGLSYPDAVYYCAQNGFNAACSVSLDGGLTFGPGVPVSNTPANDPTDPDPQVAAEGGACSGLHGHLRVGPDGTAYLPIKGCGGAPTVNNLTNQEFWGGQPAVSVSTDNGSTWTIHRVPGGHNQDESDPSVAVDKGNTVWLGWEDGTNPSDTTYGTTSAAKIAYSADDGQTWSKPYDVSSAYGIHNVQFPEVIAGDAGRVAFAFLGTDAVGNDQYNGFDGPDGNPAVWHLYVALTYDGGQHWTTYDTTPDDPVQRGCISLQGISNRTVLDPNICSQRNLLDFNDITVDGMGRVLVAYADGCTGDCVTDPTVTSTGDEDYVMRLWAGKGLYAEYDGRLPHPPGGQRLVGPTPHT